MSFEILYNPGPHKCHFPNHWHYNIGAIVQCRECGKKYELVMDKRWSSYMSYDGYGTETYEEPAWKLLEE